MSRGKTRWVLTDHATRRYIERFEPALSLEEARERLDLRLSRAKHTRSKTVGGELIWQDNELRFVMKRAREADTMLCVTVLSEADWQYERKGSGRDKNEPTGGLAALQEFLGIEDIE
jgi:hypothetical protein